MKTKKQYHRIGIDTIKSISERKLFKEVALCIIIKNTYGSGSIINFSYSLLEKKFGYSRQHLTKIVKRCIKVGLMQIKNNVLTVKNLERALKVKKRKKKSIRILFDRNTLSDVILRLKFGYLMYVYHNQERRIDKKRPSWDAYKKMAIRMKSKKMIERYKQEYSTKMMYVVFSYKYIGDAFNCSASTAFELVKRFRKQNWVDTKVIIQPVTSMTQKYYDSVDLASLHPSYYFFVPELEIVGYFLTMWKRNYGSTGFIKATPERQCNGNVGGDTKSKPKQKKQHVGVSGGGRNVSVVPTNRLESAV